MGADDELLPEYPTPPDDGVLLEARDDGRVWLALLACAALGAAGLAIAIVDLVTH